MITLFPTYMLGDLRLTSYPYAVEFGGDHGAPETVTELVQSLLADGDIVRVSRHGNREISLVVHVEGASLAEVAENEAALRRECAKLRNLLTFEPGDPLGSPASVFEVHVAEMRHPRDDEMEQHLLRRWEITLTCAPHARSADPTTVPALAAGTTTVVVDACDSVTGWSGFRNGFPYAASTAWEAGSVGVAELEDAVTSPETWGLTRTGSVDLTATPYLVVEVRTLASDSSLDSARELNFSAAADGVSLPRLSVILTSGSYYRVTFDAAAVAGVVGELAFTHVSPAGHVWQGVFIREISRTDVPPGYGPRQVSRIIDVGGTERTPASIRVASSNGTDNLGLTMVHTSPEDGSGYSPPLRRWRVAGNTVTTDSLTISGGREPLHPEPVQFNIPTSALPEGGYLLCAYVRVGLAGTYNVYFASYTEMPPPNEAITAGEVINQVEIEFPVAHTWVLVPLGIMTLPTVRTSAGQVLVGIQRANDETVDMLIDEAMLFRVDDDCALTIADVSAPNLWLDSPDVDSPVPTVWMGDSLGARTHPGPGLIAAGNHVLHPDGTAVYVATLETQLPEVSGTFYRRWHSNAAE